MHDADTAALWDDYCDELDQAVLLLIQNGCITGMVYGRPPNAPAIDWGQLDIRQLPYGSRSIGPMDLRRFDNSTPRPGASSASHSKWLA
jgi:hypothetical protein